MQKNAEGFLYPIIDNAKCTHCNLCLNVCPRVHPQYTNTENPECHAVMAPDGIRQESASGGMFSLVANYVFERKGVVCGAVFSEDYLSARHVIVEREQDLAPLRKSKYIESDTNTAFAEIKKKLQENRWVLFSGCPCQVAGLRAYLGKPYEKLILTDLVCHAIPSPLAWKAFTDEVGSGKGIKKADFRYKEISGWSVTTYIKFEDDTEYIKSFKECRWAKAANAQMLDRRSCETCQFSQKNRQGDITLADFWGIRRTRPDLDDKKGTSLILINNKKGKEIIESLKSEGKIKKIEKMDLNRAMLNNGQIYKPPKPSVGRDKFFEVLIKTKPFTHALRAGYREKFDVGLLSIWYASNYGSAMTNYALYQVIKELGYKPIFLDIPDTLWQGNKRARSNESITRKFGYKHYHISRKYPDTQSLMKLNTRCRMFVVGSDQIWNYKLVNGTFFFLDFVAEKNGKVAYGTSFGHRKFSGNETAREDVSFLLERFDAISVREEHAVRICKDVMGVNAEHVIDPVFLCDKNLYVKLAAESKAAHTKQKRERPFIAAYILDPTDEKQEVLKYTADKLGMDLVVIPNVFVDATMKKAWKMPLYEGISVEDWLYYMSHSSFVVTDSYHGLCFSTIFERPFICMANPKRGMERFQSLGDQLGIQDRIVLNPSEVFRREALLSPFDFKRISEKIELEKKRCTKWLKDSIEQALVKEGEAAQVGSKGIWYEEKLDRIRRKKNLTSVQPFIAKKNSLLAFVKKTIKKVCNMR